MTRYIQRHSSLKRAIHMVHGVATVILFITGLFIFVPALGRAAGDAMIVMHWVHRVCGVIFIAAPLFGMLVAPKGAKHFWDTHLAKWDADDVEFMKKFPMYLFSAKKMHMPKQRELKSGQRAADLGIVIFSVLIAISGVILWVDPGQGTAMMTIARVLHGVAFLFMIVFFSGHVYLGSGAFQPYRGMGRVMFGDGKISESDALYHWGYWAEDELKSGEKVSVIED